MSLQASEPNSSPFRGERPSAWADSSFLNMRKVSARPIQRSLWRVAGRVLFGSVSKIGDAVITVVDSLTLDVS